MITLKSTSDLYKFDLTFSLLHVYNIVAWLFHYLVQWWGYHLLEMQMVISCGSIVFIGYCAVQTKLNIPTIRISWNVKYHIILFWKYKLSTNMLGTDILVSVKKVKLGFINTYNHSKC